MKIKCEDCYYYELERKKGCSLYFRYTEKEDGCDRGKPKGKEAHDD